MMGVEVAWVDQERWWLSCCMEDFVLHLVNGSIVKRVLTYGAFPKVFEGIIDANDGWNDTMVVRKH